MVRTQFANLRGRAFATRIGKRLSAVADIAWGKFYFRLSSGTITLPAEVVDFLGHLLRYLCRRLRLVRTFRQQA